MINTAHYNTKDFTPAPSIHHSQPQKRMLKPRRQKTVDVTINTGDLKYLSDFIHETAFYMEELERIIGTEINDYWESREHALHIITEAIVQQVEKAGAV